MDLNNIYQANYEKALADKEKLHQASCVTIPILILVLLSLFIYASPGLKLFGGMFTIFSLIINIMFALLPVERFDYFPKANVGDLVIYNPKDKNGYTLYKVSEEHPLLNEMIPKWEVISVGKTSLVIKHGTTLMELEFNKQKDILPQPRVAQIESNPNPVSNLVAEIEIQSPALDREDII